jgi:hypothetical protein
MLKSELNQTSMKNVAKFPAKPVSSVEHQLDPRSAAILSTVRTLVAALSPAEQEQVFRQLTEMIRPIATPRAGDVLGSIVRLLPRRPDWTVSALKDTMEAEGIEATPKEIYNAISYLNRKGHIRRLGYGRYVVDGVEVVTADDLGGERDRHEDLSDDVPEDRGK